MEFGSRDGLRPASELDSVMNLAYQALSSSLVAYELVADQLRTGLRPGSSYLDTVSYTHLTLPTNREV